ncbi:hypothetical protein Gekk315_00052 [Aeromonas phage Gekk3-15]
MTLKSSNQTSTEPVIHHFHMKELLGAAMESAQGIYTQTHTDGPLAFGIVCYSMAAEISLASKRTPKASLSAVFELATRHHIGDVGSAVIESADWVDVDRNFRLSFPEGLHDDKEGRMFLAALNKQCTPDASVLLRLVKDVDR